MAEGGGEEEEEEVATTPEVDPNGQGELSIIPNATTTMTNQTQ
jgi:hypothetical protein